MFIICITSCVVGAAAVPTTIKIGVLTKGGQSHTQQHWSPLAVYLEKQIPARRFRIVPLNVDQIEAAVSGAEIDFLLANSAVFVDMENHHGVNAVLTLNRQVTADVATSVFAGVIFVKAGRGDIRTVNDLADKHFAAVDQTSLGGWAIAWRQLEINGIEPFEDLSRVEFFGFDEAVVRAVLSGRVDAGTVRAGVLERMAAGDELDLQQLRALPEKTHERHSEFHFPLLHSTAYYPEWPLASLPHTDKALVKQVVRTLLEMAPDDPAAGAMGVAGWQPPANYTPVHSLMQDLKLAQYQNYGEVGLFEAMRQHWRWMIMMVLSLVVLFVLVVYILRLNLRNISTNQALQAEMEHKLRSEQTLKAKNQNIEESEQRLAAILDNIFEAVVTIDHAGTIQTFNQAAENIFGYRQDEVMGRNVSMLMPKPDAERHDHSIKNYIMTGEAKIIGIGRETQGRRKTGEEFPLELAVSEVAVRGQRMFVGIMRDVSDKKAYEARQRQVEKLEAVAQMAGGFAHEFNNLLSSIVGYTDMLLLEVGEDNEAAADLNRVMDAAVRAKHLVGQLIEISRSDYEEALVLMPHKVVEDVVALLQGVLPEGSELNSDLAESDCRIQLSPPQFQQIVMNLGMNAIEALGENGRIDISLECVQLTQAEAGEKGVPPGEYACLCVCDNGEGIPPERLPYIFEHGYSTHNAVSGKVVGLAAIKGVVTRNNGAIEVTSEAGKGACFKVYLPCQA